MGRLYSSKEVVQFAGITYRQLDYWTRQGVVAPEREAAGTGSARGWSATQIVEVRVIAELLEQGVPMQRVRRAIGWLREHLPKLKSPLSELSFATDGKQVFYVSPNPGKLVNVLAGGQAVLIVPMEGVERIALELPAPRGKSTVEYDLPQVIELDEDGYFVASCPALRGCVTQGKTREEAQANLQEAIALYLEAVEAGEIAR